MKFFHSILALCLMAGVSCAVEEGVAGGDGLALNEHFSLQCWFTAPVSLQAENAGGMILENVTLVPVGLAIGYYDVGFDPFNVALVDEKAAKGLWGAGAGDDLRVDYRASVKIGGLSANWRMATAWDQRPPIVLMPGEGYVRPFTIAPTFFSDPRFRNLDRFHLSTVLLCGESFMVKGATVEPGKPVPLEPARKAAAGGVQIVEIDRRRRDPAPPVAPAGAGPVVACVFARRVEADLEMRYAVLNTGATTAWVWQNSAVPGGVAISIREGEREVAGATGEALAVLTALLPAREAVQLHAGEGLSWGFRVPAAALAPLRGRRAYDVRLTVPVRSAAGERPDDMPQPTALSASTTIVW